MNEQAHDTLRVGARAIGAGQVFLGAGSEPPATRNANVEQLANVYRLNDPAFAEMPLEPLMDELLGRIQQILDVDTVAILLLDDAGETLIARAAKGLEEEVERGVRIPIGAGFAGRIASERLPIFIADVQHADVLNPILREKGISSLLGVPLIVEGTLMGVLHVGTLQPRTFTNEDATVLQLAGMRVAPAIERARLLDVLDHQHRGAMVLQRSLLPDQLTQPIGVPVAARYFPARDEVGGDWYDIVELGPGKVGIAIGDVAGHGVRAATLMGQLRTGLRAYTIDGYEPGAALERVDRLLQSIRGRGMATAICASFDAETGTLRLSSAGHPPPLVCSASAASRLVETSTGPPLGALRHSRYTETELTLEPGDIFVLYSDGLVERRGQVLDLGLDRLLEATRGASSPEEVCSEVVSRLVARDETEDDIAIVALQRSPVPANFFLRLAANPSVLAQLRAALRRWLRTQGAGTAEIDTIALACGEAAANAIEHAYSPGAAFFEVEGRVHDGHVHLAVRDTGVWRAPRGEHRGRGLTIMNSLMDSVHVNATEEGTEVLMRLRIGSSA